MKNHYSKILFTFFIFITVIFFYEIYQEMTTEYPITVANNIAVLNSKLSKYPQKITIENLGQFGSAFGGLNTFLTSISLLILGLSLIYQTWQYKKQQADNTLRDVENNFFKLLDQLRSIVQSIDVTRPNGTKFNGGEAFSIMLKTVKRINSEIKQNSFHGYEKDLRNRIMTNQFQKKSAEGQQSLLNGFSKALKNLHLDKNDNFMVYIKCHEVAFLTVYYKYEHDLAHYFRLIYRTIHYVDSQNIDFTKKLEMISLLRAMLSTGELILFFYNVTSIHGEKFRKFAEKYAFFDNVETDDLLEHFHKNKLKHSAFNTREATEIFIKNNSILYQINRWRIELENNKND